MHDPDSETAKSIALNIQYNKEVAKYNPYFNKIQEKE